MQLNQLERLQRKPNANQLSQELILVRQEILQRLVQSHLMNQTLQ